MTSSVSLVQSNETRQIIHTYSSTSGNLIPISARDASNLPATLWYIQCKVDKSNEQNANMKDTKEYINMLLEKD